MKEQTRETLMKSVVPTLLIVLFSLGIDLSRMASKPVEAIITSMFGFYLLTVLMGMISQALPWRLGIRATVLFILSFAVMTLGTGIELQNIFLRRILLKSCFTIINGLWQLGYLRILHSLSFQARSRRFIWSCDQAALGATKLVFMGMAGSPGHDGLYLPVFCCGALSHMDIPGPYYSDPSFGLNTHGSTYRSHPLGAG